MLWLAKWWSPFLILLMKTLVMALICIAPGEHAEFHGHYRYPRSFWGKYSGLTLVIRLLCKIIPVTENSGDVSWRMHVAPYIEKGMYFDAYDTIWKLKLCGCESCMIWMANDGVYYSYCWWRSNLWLCSVFLLENQVNLTAHTNAQGDTEVSILSHHLKSNWYLRSNLPQEILLMTLIHSSCAHSQTCSVYDPYYHQKC